jgi:hypothetical protein
VSFWSGRTNFKTVMRTSLVRLHATVHLPSCGPAPIKVDSLATDT